MMMLEQAREDFLSAMKLFKQISRIAISEPASEAKLTTSSEVTDRDHQK